MSDLWTSLGQAARALEAQRFGLDVTGQNIANAATPGYARRVVELAEVPGRGVEVIGLRGARDILLERRLREERPAAGRDAAMASALSLVETALGRPGESVDATMTRFFDSFAELAGDPTSAAARQGVVLAGQALAQDFNAFSASLLEARRHADAEVRAAVDQANELTTRIAELNARLSGTPDGNALSASLQDQLHGALHELAGIMDIDVLQNRDGTVGVTFRGGRLLVAGAQSFALGVTASPPFGFADITSDGVTVTGGITSGRLGGHLQVRDTLVPQYQLELDTLAFTVAGQVNAAHLTGFDAGGAAAGNFFTPLGAVAGAAASLAVLPAVVADPREVAAAGVALPGDNQVASLIAALRDVPAVGGTLTFADAWGQLSFRIGQDAFDAQRDRDGREDILRQMETLRDSASGVSLDEEALRLMQFQRAYEANARVFRAVDEALSTLINMIGA